MWICVEVFALCAFLCCASGGGDAATADGSTVLPRFTELMPREPFPMLSGNELEEDSPTNAAPRDDVTAAPAGPSDVTWPLPPRTVPSRRNPFNFYEFKRFSYPTLFRDYVYRELSKRAQKVFFAITIHPSCLKKNGFCIKRHMCTTMVLYISRSCYHRDYVCCYDNIMLPPTLPVKEYTRKPTTTIERRTASSPPEPEPEPEADETTKTEEETTTEH